MQEIENIISKLQRASELAIQSNDPALADKVYLGIVAMKEQFAHYCEVLNQTERTPMAFINPPLTPILKFEDLLPPDYFNPCHIRIESTPLVSHEQPSTNNEEPFPWPGTWYPSTPYPGPLPDDEELAELSHLPASL